MRISQSIDARWQNWKCIVHRPLEALLPGILLFSPAFCLGQVQQPPLVPMSQGAGPGAGRIGALQQLSGAPGALTDRPIFPGETVHVAVFEAPDFSTVMQVSEGGDIAVPVVGPVHVEGLNSQKAEELIEARLKTLDLVLNPHVTVTVDSPETGITVLGEVHSPGIYQPMGKHTLSDLLAAAGGLTGNTGRVIEISSDRTPGKKVDIAWDPTMHNTGNYEYPIHAGDRVLIKSCGIAYVGGHVGKPGAYSLCGSPTITLSEIIAIAGGETPYTKEKHTYLIRTEPDGSRVAQLIDLHRVLRTEAADPVIREDDIIYVSPSTLKTVVTQALTWVMATGSEAFYIYQPGR